MDADTDTDMVTDTITITENINLKTSVNNVRVGTKTFLSLNFFHKINTL